MTMPETSKANQRVRVVHPEGGPLMTKQAMALDTDVNHIMKRWVTTGVIPFGAGGQAPRYGDFSSGTDFQTAINQVREAEAQFDMLPAHIRRYCHNDPQKFLELVYDPERRDDLVKLGLVKEQLPDQVIQAEAAAVHAATRAKKSEEDPAPTGGPKKTS